MSETPVSEASTEILQEAVDTTYDLGREAGRRLVRMSFFSGFGGLVVGSAASYFLTRRILETKYNKITEEEIAVMREHYRNKMVALDNENNKAKLEDIVKEQGYSVNEETEPPMAVSPPLAVVEAATEDVLNAAAELETISPSEIETPEEPGNLAVRNVFEEVQKSGDWNYHKELAKRSPVRPYVIHIDEREEQPYDEITLTYYEGDDVLCDERDEVIGNPDRDRMVGETNLERFGHGSNNDHVVYIRNDKLEAQYEIVRSPNSYAKEVHGFEHADTRRPRRGRLPYDDE